MTDRLCLLALSLLALSLLALSLSRMEECDMNVSLAKLPSNRQMRIASEYCIRVPPACQPIIIVVIIIIIIAAPTGTARLRAKHSSRPQRQHLRRRAVRPCMKIQINQMRRLIILQPLRSSMNPSAIASWSQHCRTFDATLMGMSWF